MRIEDALEKLEKIAEKLENEKTSLDESLELFNEGTEIAEKCAEILADGKGKLVLLKKKMDKISEEKFELDD